MFFVVGGVAIKVPNPPLTNGQNRSSATVSREFRPNVGGKQTLLKTDSVFLLKQASSGFKVQDVDHHFCNKIIFFEKVGI